MKAAGRASRALENGRYHLPRKRWRSIGPFPHSQFRAARYSTSTPLSEAETTPDIQSEVFPTPELNIYDSPPSDDSIRTADTFFSPKLKGAPRLLFTTSHFRSIPFSASVPEVTFIGRSNVGKSTLLNRLFGARDSNPLAFASKHAGKTITMNGYAIGSVRLTRGSSKSRAGGNPKLSNPQTFDTITAQGRDPGIVVLDMPGYGRNSRDLHGVEVMKYISKRPHLRRVFLLIDAYTGVKALDRDILRMLREIAAPHSVILTKADAFVSDRRRALVREGRQGEQEAEILAQLRRRVEQVADELGDLRPGLDLKMPEGAVREVIVTCASDRKALFPSLGRGLVSKEGYFGIAALRHAVLMASGLEFAGGKFRQRQGTLSSFASADNQQGL